MNRFNKLPKYLKINFLMVTISVVAILSLTVGYSILSEKLDIEGTIVVQAAKDIRINTASNISAASGGYEVYALKYTATTITSSIGLANLDSTVSYTFTIKNYGTSSMQIKSINVSAYDNDSISYNISGIDTTTTFVSGEQKEFTITFAYADTIATAPANQVLNSLFEIEFQEYTAPTTPEYVMDDLIFDLRGSDAPIDGAWYDRVSNEPVTLTNVSYIASKQQYNFTLGGYGKATKPFIPEITDFTVEVHVQLPSVLANKDDQAILSQISDTSNSDGRFKINYVYSNQGSSTYHYSLLIFSNETSKKSNTFNFFKRDVLASEDYVLTVVRTNGNLYLYLNGSLVTTAVYPAANKIAQQALKLGRFNDSNPQLYNGTMNSVRIYNRALTAQEVAHNYTVEMKKYNGEIVAPPSTYDTIKEYAIGTGLTVTGDGLYAYTDGYIYKGVAVNNYIKFDGETDLYRIIKFLNDGSMELVDVTDNLNVPFDEEGYREKSDYCVASTDLVPNTTNMYGCNAFSAETTGVIKNASIDNYINGTYYDSMPTMVKEKLIKHDYKCGQSDPDAAATVIANIGKTICNLNVGLLTIEDMILSSSTTITTVSSTTTGVSYLYKLSAADSAIWTMNGFTKNSYDVWTILSGTSISGRRASRYSQDSFYFYAYPTIYVADTYGLYGAGTLADPFVIK